MSANNHKPAPLGPPIPALIGSSPAMEAVYRLTRKVAATNSMVHEVLEAIERVAGC